MALLSYLMELLFLPLIVSLGPALDFILIPLCLLFGFFAYVPCWPVSLVLLAAALVGGFLFRKFANRDSRRWKLAVLLWLFVLLLGGVLAYEYYFKVNLIYDSRSVHLYIGAASALFMFVSKLVIFLGHYLDVDD